MAPSDRMGWRRGRTPNWFGLSPHPPPRHTIVQTHGQHLHFHGIWGFSPSASGFRVHWTLICANSKKAKVGFSGLCIVAPPVIPRVSNCPADWQRDFQIGCSECRQTWLPVQRQLAVRWSSDASVTHTHSPPLAPCPGTLLIYEPQVSFNGLLVLVRGKPLWDFFKNQPFCLRQMCLLASSIYRKMALFSGSLH